MDPIAILLAATRGTVVLALMFVVPGLTLGPIVAPGASSRLARLGRAVGVSLVVTAIACTGLARLGLLRPTIVIALLVGLTLLPLHSRLPRRGGRPALHARRWWLGAVVGAVLAVALAILPSGLKSGGTVLPSGATSWTDAALAWSTAASGGFRADLPAWGALGPLGVDHGPLIAHSAATFLLMPAEQLLQLGLYRLAVLVAGLILATLLFRRWVSTWIALLGAILLFRTVWIEAAVSGYGPAGWALAVALFGLWLTDRAIVERSRRLVLAATVTAAVVLAVHVEVFLVLVAAVAGVAIGRALVSPGGGPESAGGLGHRHGRRVGLRSPLAWDVVRPLALGAAIVVAGTLFGLVGDLVLTGDDRIIGYIRSGPPAGSITPTLVGQPPAGWRPSGDATWDFHVAATDASQFGQPPPATFVDDRILPASAVHIWPMLDGRTLLGLVALALLLAIPLGGWPFADVRRQRAILGWTAFTALLLGGSFVLFSLLPTYVPRRIGPTGLIPYVAIVPVAAAVIGLWWLGRFVGSRLRWRLRRGAMPLAGIVLAIVATAIILPVIPPAEPEPDAERPSVLSHAGYDAYRWIASLPAETHVLSNAWTEGTFAALTERTGIVDGPAPYLRDPALLAHTTGLLLDARNVFAEPDGPVAATFLEREQVGYLLVVTHAGSADDLASHEPFPVDLATLESSTRYRLEQSFGDRRLLVFRVLD